MNASQENLWPAPFASKSLDATVVVPGSKSLSNRYLILAALGHRPVRLVGLLRSRDTELMMDALRSLGVRCEIDEQVDTTVRWCRRPTAGSTVVRRCSAVLQER